LMNIYGKSLEFAYSFLAKFTPYKCWRYYKELLMNQYLPTEKIHELQWKRFKAILNHAGTNVPFYKQKFKAAGIRPDDIKNRKDIQKIPFTTRQELSDLFPHDTIAEGFDYNDLFLVQTSGTTEGLPFRFYIDREALNRKYALLLRNYSFFNWHFGKKMMSLWNHSHEDYLPFEHRSLIKSFVYEFVHRKKLLPPFYKNCTLDEGKGMEYFRKVDSFKPYLVEADGFALFHIGKFFYEHKLIPGSIKAISAATCPTTPSIRNQICKFWGSPVFNNYGPHEMEGIGCECHERKGLHQSVDSYVIEFISGDETAAENELSEIVVTDLDNFAMPFIRYRLGDIVRAGISGCTCNRTLPLMNDVEGRKEDLIRTENGIFTENTFQDFFEKFNLQNQFKIIQKTRLYFSVEIIRNNKITPDYLASMEKGLIKLLGDGVKIQLEITDSIPCEESGKFRLVKSTII